MADTVLVNTPKFGGFTETFIYRHVMGMKRLKPMVMAYHRLNEDIFPAEGIEVMVHSPHPMTLWMKVVLKFDLKVNRWAWPSSSLELAERVCRENEVKAMVAYYGHVGVSLIPLMKKLGIPTLVHFLGSDASILLRNRKYVSLLREAWPLFSKVVVPSKFLGDQLLGVGCPEDILRVLYLGVPLPKEKRNDDPKESVCFLHVGSLTEKKGVSYSIQAFARALPELPDSRLVIVGEGKERGACEALVKKHGLEGRVEFHNYLPNEKCQELYREADIFVQHSVTASNGDTEGLPVSILEAQANGLPVISTRHAGIPEEVAEGETGLLVEERDVEGMAEGMVRLGGDPELRGRMGEAGRANIERNFELERQNRELEDLILEMIACQKRRTAS